MKSDGLEHSAFLLMHRVLHRSTKSQGRVHRLKIQQHDERQTMPHHIHLRVLVPIALSLHLLVCVAAVCQGAMSL